MYVCMLLLYAEELQRAKSDLESKSSLVEELEHQLQDAKWVARQKHSQLDLVGGEPGREGKPGCCPRCEAVVREHQLRNAKWVAGHTCYTSMTEGKVSIMRETT